MAQAQQTHVTGWTGWIGFASFFMAVSGIVHIIYGLGGIFAQDWYIISTTNSAYLFDVTALGWSLFIGGFLLLISAALLMAGNMLGRIAGVLLSTASLLVNLALIGISPVWSILAIVVNMLIIYAIVAHGSEMKLRDEEQL
jgi:hypothetical protein